MTPYYLNETHYIKEKPAVQAGLSIIRHRAIFPGLDDPSIVTAARLNFCVRDGNRCLPRAMGTESVTTETNLRFFSSRGVAE